VHQQLYLNRLTASLLEQTTQHRKQSVQNAAVLGHLQHTLSSSTQTIDAVSDHGAKRLYTTFIYHTTSKTN